MTIGRLITNIPHRAWDVVAVGVSQRTNHTHCSILCRDSRAHTLDEVVERISVQKLHMPGAIRIGALRLVWRGSHWSGDDATIEQHITIELTSIHRTIFSHITKGAEGAGNNLSQLVMQSTNHTRHTRTFWNDRAKTLLDDTLPSGHALNASMFAISTIRQAERRHKRIRSHVGKFTDRHLKTNRIRGRRTTRNGHFTNLRPNLQPLTTLKQQLSSSTVAGRLGSRTTRTARHGFLPFFLYVVVNLHLETKHVSTDIGDGFYLTHC